MVYLAALYGASAFTSYLGGRKADREQARMERLNAQYFNEQADFIKLSGQIEMHNMQSQGEKLIGEQISTFARSAVELSGSAMTTIASTESAISKEVFAIRVDAKHSERLARLRAKISMQTADSLERSSFMRNVGHLLGGAANIASLDRGVGTSPKKGASGGGAMDTPPGPSLMTPG